MQIDSRAVKLFYAKDEKTVSAIYSTYFRLLKHICFGCVHDMAEAEDCAQEAFLRVYQSSMESTHPDVFLSYLCKAAKNVALDHLRMRKPVELDEEDASSTEFHYSDELLDCLKTFLTPIEFDVVTMHYCLGLGFDEIGAALGMTSSAARGISHRAKAKAKSALKKEEWL